MRHHQCRIFCLIVALMWHSVIVSSWAEDKLAPAQIQAGIGPSAKLAR